MDSVEELRERLRNTHEDCDPRHADLSSWSNVKLVACLLDTSWEELAVEILRRLDRMEDLEAIADPVRDLFDGEGTYAGSIAEKIERLVDEHGSAIMQEIVSQHFDTARQALSQEKDHA